MNSYAMAEKDGYRLTIFADDNAESPREWDNLGTMVCWHSRYTLGDKHTHADSRSLWLNIIGKNDDDDGIADMTDEDLLAVARDYALIFPLYLYDHGGITISMSRTGQYADRWDAGQVGWIFVTHEKIKKEYGHNRITKKLIARITGYLENEVKTYDQYLSGDVYGFKLEKVYTVKGEHSGREFDDSETIDSCWGFYGDDCKENGLIEHIPAEHAELVELLK